MKRFCIACLTALAALSAQAVTINWNNDVDWGAVSWRDLNIDSNGYRDISHISSTGKAAYRLNVRFGSDLPSSGTLLMLGGLLNNAFADRVAGITLSLAGDGVLSASLRDERGTRAIAGGGSLAQGLNQIVVAIDRHAVEGDTYHALISIFVNGEEAFTYDGHFGGVTFDRITLGRGYNLDDTPLDVDYTSYNAAISTSGTDGFQGIDQIRDAYDALLLPEPTALALLALGVAGLALRRKAA